MESKWSFCFVVRFAFFKSVKWKIFLHVIARAGSLFDPIISDRTRFNSNTQQDTILYSCSSNCNVASDLSLTNLSL